MKQTHTVATLRQAKNKVRVIHLRYKNDDIEFSTLYPIKNLEGKDRGHLGGVTKVEITLKDGRDLSGEAVCSKKEAFNRKVGLKIALNRALKGVEV